MKKLTLALFAAAAIWSAPAAAQDIELNISHILTERSGYHEGSVRFAEKLEELTEGRVNVSVYHSGALGGELRLMQGGRVGATDLFYIGQPTIENLVPEYRLLSLPYLFDDQEQAHRVLAGPVGDKLLAKLEDYGLVGLGWGVIFERWIGSTRAIEAVDDMQGLKIRVLQSPGYVEGYTSLGAQPTPMALAEAYIALQTGVVDAVEHGPDQLVEQKFVEVARHIAQTRVHQLPSVLVMSKAKFDALPEDVQEAVREAGRESVAAAIRYHDELTAEAIEAMNESDVQITSPDIGPFGERSRASWQGIIAGIADGDALVEEIEAAKRQ